jgi:hypothetical protein
LRRQKPLGNFLDPLDSTMTTRLLRIGAWLALAAVIFVTISPIGLRPRDVVSTNFDRAAAYAVMSALFVFAYPRHWRMVAVLMIVTAGGAELFQYLSPTRHPQPMDAAIKVSGGAFGLLAGHLLYLGRTRFQPRRAEVMRD